MKWGWGQDGGGGFLPLTDTDTLCDPVESSPPSSSVPHKNKTTKRFSEKYRDESPEGKVSA